MPPQVTLAAGGELVPTSNGRTKRLIQVYTDPGGLRTLALADISLH